MPPVDVCINSAGITHTGSFTDTNRNVFEVRQRRQGGRRETREEV